MTERAAARPGGERTVGTLVARAAGAARAVRGAQAALVALAACSSVQAVITFEGGAPFAAQAWLVGALTGLCAGAAWWFGLPVERGAVAGRIDNLFERDGAFATAWEAQPDGGPVAQALATRALDGLSWAAVVRRAMPDSTVAGAAPLLAAALLALALEARDEPSSKPQVAALANDLAQDLARAAQQAGRPGDGPESEATASAVAAAAAEAADLAERADRRPEASDHDTERLEALVDELERLAVESPMDAPWRAALDAARIAADALSDAGGGGDVAARDAEPGAGGGGADAAGDGSEPAGAGAVEGLALPAAGAPELLAPDLAPADAAVVAAWVRHLAERERR